MHGFCLIGDNWRSETTMKKTGDKMQILSWETRPALEREHGQGCAPNVETGFGTAGSVL